MIPHVVHCPSLFVTPCDAELYCTLSRIAQSMHFPRIRIPCTPFPFASIDLGPSPRPPPQSSHYRRDFRRVILLTTQRNPLCTGAAVLFILWAPSNNIEYSNGKSRSRSGTVPQYSKRRSCRNFQLCGPHHLTYPYDIFQVSSNTGVAEPLTASFDLNPPQSYRVNHRTNPDIF